MRTLYRASFLTVVATLTPSVDVEISAQSPELNGQGSLLTTTPTPLLAFDLASKWIIVNVANQARAQISPFTQGNLLSGGGCQNGAGNAPGCSGPSASPVTPPTPIVPPVVSPHVVTPPVATPTVPTTPGCSGQPCSGTPGAGGAGGKGGKGGTGGGGGNSTVNQELNVVAPPDMAVSSGWCMRSLSLSAGVLKAAGGISVSTFQEACGRWYAISMAAGGPVCVSSMFATLHAADDKNVHTLGEKLKMAVDSCHPSFTPPAPAPTPRPYSKWEFSPMAKGFKFS